MLLVTGEQTRVYVMNIPHGIWRKKRDVKTERDSVGEAGKRKAIENIRANGSRA